MSYYLRSRQNEFIIINIGLFIFADWDFCCYIPIQAKTIYLTIGIAGLRFVNRINSCHHLSIINRVHISGELIMFGLAALEKKLRFRRPNEMVDEREVFYDIDIDNNTEDLIFRLNDDLNKPWINLMTIYKNSKIVLHNHDVCSALRIKNMGFKVDSNGRVEVN